MQLFIRVAGMPVGVVEVTEDDTVQTLVEKVSDTQGLPLDLIVLRTTAGKILWYREFKLRDYHLQDLTTLECTTRAAPTATSSEKPAASDADATQPKDADKDKAVEEPEDWMSQDWPDLGVEVSCTEVGARDISLKILGSRKLPAKSQFKVVLQSALGQDKVCLFSDCQRNDILRVDGLTPDTPYRAQVKASSVGCLSATRQTTSVHEWFCSDPIPVRTKTEGQMRKLWATLDVVMTLPPHEVNTKMKQLWPALATLRNVWKQIATWKTSFKAAVHDVPQKQTLTSPTCADDLDLLDVAASELEIQSSESDEKMAECKTMSMPDLVRTFSPVVGQQTGVDELWKTQEQLVAHIVATSNWARAINDKKDSKPARRDEVESVLADLAQAHKHNWHRIFAATKKAKEHIQYEDHIQKTIDAACVDDVVHHPFGVFQQMQADLRAQLASVSRLHGRRSKILQELVDAYDQQLHDLQIIQAHFHDRHERAVSVHQELLQLLHSDWQRRLGKFRTSKAQTIADITGVDTCMCGTCGPCKSMQELVVSKKMDKMMKQHQKTTGLIRTGLTHLLHVFRSPDYSNWSGTLKQWRWKLQESALNFDKLDDWIRTESQLVQDIYNVAWKDRAAMLNHGKYPSCLTGVVDSLCDYIWMIEHVLVKQCKAQLSLLDVSVKCVTWLRGQLVQSVASGSSIKSLCDTVARSLEAYNQLIDHVDALEVQAERDRRKAARRGLGTQASTVPQQLQQARQEVARGLCNVSSAASQLSVLSLWYPEISVDFEDLFFPELFELVGQDLMPIHSHLMTRSRPDDDNVLARSTTTCAMCELTTAITPLLVPSKCGVTTWLASTAPHERALVRAYPLGNPTARRAFVNDVAFHREVNHPSIPQLKHVLADDTHYYTVLVHETRNVGNVTLRQWIDEEHKKLQASSQDNELGAKQLTDKQLVTVHQIASSLVAVVTYLHNNRRSLGSLSLDSIIISIGNGVGLSVLDIAGPSLVPEEVNQEVTEDEQYEEEEKKASGPPGTNTVASSSVKVSTSPQVFAGFSPRSLLVDQDVGTPEFDIVSILQGQPKKERPGPLEHLGDTIMERTQRASSHYPCGQAHRSALKVVDPSVTRWGSHMIPDPDDKATPTASDIWALGCVLLSLYAPGVEHVLLPGRSCIRLQSSSALGRLAPVLERCVQRRAADRLTARELQQRITDTLHQEFLALHEQNKVVATEPRVRAFEHVLKATREQLWTNLDSLPITTKRIDVDVPVMRPGQKGVPEMKSSRTVREKRVSVEHMLEIFFNLTPHELRRKLTVTFQGEDGQDGGALTAELYRQFFEQVGLIDNKFFEGPLHNTALLPTQSNQNSNAFIAIGRILAKCLFDGRRIPGRFLASSVFKYLLDLPLTFQDLEEHDPQMASSLEHILRISSDAELEAMDMCFVASDGTPLKANGDELAVTMQNKQEYVDLVTQHVLVNSRADQLKAMKNGFRLSVFDPVLRLLDGASLRLLLCGPDVITADMVKKVLCFTKFPCHDSDVVGGCPCTSFACFPKMFCSVLDDMTGQDLRRFLIFATAEDAVPEKVTVSMTNTNTEINRPLGYPVSHACFKIVDMPRYRSREELRSRLYFVLYSPEAIGFSIY